LRILLCGPRRLGITCYNSSMRRLVKKVSVSLAFLMVSSCCTVEPRNQSDRFSEKVCINAIEKVILATKRYKDWLSDCKKQVGQKSEDGEKLISCGFRGPLDLQQSEDGSAPDLEWAFHSNWSGRISVEMWLRFNREQETVEEMIGDYEPIEFDKSQLGEIKKHCK